MIRPAHEDDVCALGAILSAFVDETPWIPRVHSRAQDIAHAGELVGRGWVHVACAGGVRGFIARDLEEIHALYLTQHVRRQGIGKALLDHAKRAQPRLRVWSFEANAGARRFYAREGFAQVARTDGVGNDEGLPDVQLVWERGSV